MLPLADARQMGRRRQTVEPEGIVGLGTGVSAAQATLSCMEGNALSPLQRARG